MKALGILLGTLRALPHLLRYALAAAVLGEVKAFVGGSERIAGIPGYVGVYTRQAFYRRRLAGVGTDVYFGYQSVFSKRAAIIGDRTYVGRFCSVGWAEIGDDVMLADYVQVLSGRHQHGGEGANGEAVALREQEQSFSKVTIGRGAWIGAGAIVMADVGEGAVVGAGAVVVKPVPAGDRVGGVPAKPLKA